MNQVLTNGNTETDGNCSPVSDVITINKSKYKKKFKQKYEKDTNPKAQVHISNGNGTSSKKRLRLSSMSVSDTSLDIKDDIEFEEHHFQQDSIIYPIPGKRKIGIEKLFENDKLSKTSKKKYENSTSPKPPIHISNENRMSPRSLISESDISLDMQDDVRTEEYHFQKNSFILPTPDKRKVGFENDKYLKTSRKKSSNYENYTSPKAQVHISNKNRVSPMKRLRLASESDISLDVQDNSQQESIISPTPDKRKSGFENDKYLKTSRKKSSKYENGMSPKTYINNENGFSPKKYHRLASESDISLDIKDDIEIEEHHFQPDILILTTPDKKKIGLENDKYLKKYRKKSLVPENEEVNTNSESDTTYKKSRKRSKRTSQSPELDFRDAVGVQNVEKDSKDSSKKAHELENVYQIENNSASILDTSACAIENSDNELNYEFAQRMVSSLEPFKDITENGGNESGKVGSIADTNSKHNRSIESPILELKEEIEIEEHYIAPQNVNTESLQFENNYDSTFLDNFVNDNDSDDFLQAGQHFVAQPNEMSDEDESEDSENNNHEETTQTELANNLDTSEFELNNIISDFDSEDEYMVKTKCSPKKKKKRNSFDVLLNQPMKLAFDIIPTWPVPPQHFIETRLTRAPTDRQKKEFHELGVEMKTGPFNTTEDEIIERNFISFCETYDVEKDPKLFFSTKQYRDDNKITLSSFNRKQRLNFGRYLAKDIPDRYLYTIYSRFQTMYFPVVKRGRFTKEEDEILLNYMRDTKHNFAMAADLLGRGKQSVEKRYYLLTARNFNNKISWTKDSIESFIETLLKHCDVEDVEQLRGKTIPTIIWDELSKDFQIGPMKLRQFWLGRLSPQLYAKSEVSLTSVRITLIELFRRARIESARDIRWKEVALYFNGLTPMFLWNKFNHLVRLKVPVRLRSNFAESMKYLYKNVIPELGESHYDRILKRYTYTKEDGLVPIN